MEGCLHLEFDASVSVNRLEDVGRFTADVKIKCANCGVPMRFIGLPCGVDLNGASVSADGTEGRFAIAPQGEVLSEIEGTSIGFTMRKDIRVGPFTEDHIQQMTLDGKFAIKVRCPKCGTWAYADDDQLQGKVSLDCQSCDFHETHDLRRLIEPNNDE